MGYILDQDKPMSILPAYTHKRFKKYPHWYNKLVEKTLGVLKANKLDVSEKGIGPDKGWSVEYLDDNGKWASAIIMLPSLEPETTDQATLSFKSQAGDPVDIEFYIRRLEDCPIQLIAPVEIDRHQIKIENGSPKLRLIIRDKGGQLTEEETAGLEKIDDETYADYADLERVAEDIYAYYPSENTILRFEKDPLTAKEVNRLIREYRFPNRSAMTVKGNEASHYVYAQYYGHQVNGKNAYVALYTMTND